MRFWYYFLCLFDFTTIFNLRTSFIMVSEIHITVIIFLGSGFTYD